MIQNEITMPLQDMVALVWMIFSYIHSKMNSNKVVNIKTLSILLYLCPLHLTFRMQKRYKPRPEVTEHVYVYMLQLVLAKV